MIERTFIEHGMKKIQLEQYLKKQLSRAGFTGLHMVKTPLVTRIVLVVAKPGLAIGKGGQNIKQLTEEIAKRFDIDNPQIEIQDIQDPALDARATVDKMVELIERGFSWKSVAFRTVREINEAGAQGVELVLKGKLSGKGGRKRKHRVAHGYMKKVGNQVRLVDTAKASAYPKAGAVGITLSIIRPEVVFPDKVDISKAVEKEKAKEEAGQGEKEAGEAKEGEKAEGEEKEAGKEKREAAGKEKEASEEKKQAKEKEKAKASGKEKAKASKKEKAKVSEKEEAEADEKEKEKARGKKAGKKAKEEKEAAAKHEKANKGKEAAAKHEKAGKNKEKAGKGKHEKAGKKAKKK